MPKLPRLTGKEIIKALAKTGFVVCRIRGSHHFIKHSDGRGTVIPVHSGEIIGPGLLLKILRDIELSKDDLENLL